MACYTNLSPEKRHKNLHKPYSVNTKRVIITNCMKAHFLLNSSDNDFESFRIQCENLGETWNVSHKIILEVILIIEELYTNYFQYTSTGTTNSVEVSLERIGPELVIVYKDSGPAFNPLQVPPPDIHLPFEERQAGGLGVHLVRHFADSYTYARKDKKNILRLTKTIK